jgi:hypothetical protein
MKQSAIAVLLAAVSGLAALGYMYGPSIGQAATGLDCMTALSSVQRERGCC